jgi:branched-subunit amino acid transport protein
MRMPLSTWELLLAIVSLSVATFVTRAGLLLVGERLRLSHRVEAALRFAPACALSALVLPEIVSPAGVLDLSTGNPRWPAAIAAGLFLLWRPSMTGSLVIGMAVFAVFRFW